MFSIVHVILIYSYYVTYSITFCFYVSNPIFICLHSALFVMTVICYYKAAFTDAGPIHIVK